MVEQQVEEKSREEECQVETLPPKTTLKDMCINQQIKEFSSSFRNALGRKTYEIKRKEKSELSVINELSKKSEKNGKHLVRENKQGISEKKLETESIKKDKETVIHHEYTNNFNPYFSSDLKVLLQTSMPYKDPFDDFIEVSYAFKGIYRVFIRCKKNIRHKYFKLGRKPQVYSSYKFEKIISTFEVWN